MPYEIDVTYTLDLLKKITFQATFRRLKKVFVIYTLIGLLALALSSLCPGAGLLYVLSLAVLFSPFLVLATWYFQSLRISKRTMALLQGKPIKLTFQDDKVISDSEIGHSELKWPAFDKLEYYPDFWLLYMEPVRYFVLPLEKLSPEAQAFLTQKVQENGGKILK